MTPEFGPKQKLSTETEFLSDALERSTENQMILVTSGRNWKNHPCAEAPYLFNQAVLSLRTGYSRVAKIMIEDHELADSQRAGFLGTVLGERLAETASELVELMRPGQQTVGNYDKEKLTNAFEDILLSDVETGEKESSIASYAMTVFEKDLTMFSNAMLAEYYTGKTAKKRERRQALFKVAAVGLAAAGYTALKLIEEKPKATPSLKNRLAEGIARRTA
jgi:hypothetical protein